MAFEDRRYTIIAAGRIASITAKLKDNAPDGVRKGRGQSTVGWFLENNEDTLRHTVAGPDMVVLKWIAPELSPGVWDEDFRPDGLTGADPAMLHAEILAEMAKPEWTPAEPV